MRIINASLVSGVRVSVGKRSERAKTIEIAKKIASPVSSPDDADSCKVLAHSYPTLVKVSSCLAYVS